MPSALLINEFPTPTAASEPYYIAVGPNGNLWFTEWAANQFGEINPVTHAMSEFPIPTPGSGPGHITSGPDGNVWFTEEDGDRIAEVNPATHAVREFPTPAGNSAPTGITVGPDGNLWFDEENAFKIGEINPQTGAISEFAIPTPNSAPTDIAAGPDGNLWFTEAYSNKVGEINPSTDAIGDFALPTANALLSSITAGPDGNLWFTEYRANKIGEIDPWTDGITEFTIPTPNSQPNDITAGPDGNLWFTENSGSKIGEFNPMTHTIREFPTPTPGSGPVDICEGPDGNLWFTEESGTQFGNGNRIGEVALVPALSALAGSNQSTAVATAFGTLPEVQVLDVLGDPVLGASVTFTESNGPGGAGGAFSGGTTVTTNAQGLALAPVLIANHTAGTFTVTATLGGLATTFNLTNTPGAPAAITAVGGDAQNTPIGSAYGTLLQAEVTDAFGNPVSAVPVAFGAPTTGASGNFGALPTVPTNALGIATAPAFMANHVPGSFSVTATAAGLTNPASFSLTNTTVPAAIVPVAGTPQHVPVTGAYTPLRARVTDAGGNPVGGITVVFALPATGPGGTFAGSASVLTDANGVAQAPALAANQTAGRFTITAWVAGVSTPARFLLTNTPGAAKAVHAFLGTPQSATVARAYATPLQAQVVDAFGNGVRGVRVTFSAPPTGAGGTFAGALSAMAVTGVNGVATAPSLTANTRAGSFTVIASASGLGTPAAFPLTNVPGPVARLVPVAGSTPQIVTINSAFGVALAVKVTDAFGNTEGGLVVTFTVHPNLRTGSQATFSVGGLTTTATTASSGLTPPAPTLTADADPGTFTVIARIPGVSTQALFTLTIT